jgi:predicted RNA-binding Zn-ribbon protein involved in translation (DUF1610 family)
MDEIYVALFCPHCGEHLNEIELEDELLYATEPMDPAEKSAAFTCGWCGIRTNNWAHVSQCKKTFPGLTMLRFKQAAARVAEIERELALGTEAKTAF